MAKILITSGPTRQYLDPVRYLTNASSGRMGVALAQSALALGHQVLVISGPVHVTYPSDAVVVSVRTTQEMLLAAREHFRSCDGAIGAAAPCDYQPRVVSEQKLSKTGEGIQLHLIETPDVIATLGSEKQPHQWVVGFALETQDHRFRATVKLQKKLCDLIVSNDPSAIDSPQSSVELLNGDGDVLAALSGDKASVAEGLLREIDQRLIQKSQPAA